MIKKAYHALLEKDLLLVGAGHAHCLALRMLGMKPLPSVRVTIVSDSCYAPYSGMLPSLIARRIPFSDAHIDVPRLADWAGAVFIQGDVSRINPDKKEVELSSGRILRGDIISLNVGVHSPVFNAGRDAETLCSVKPVQQFMRWLAVMEEEKKGQIFQLAIIGGGVAAIELALALDTRFEGKAQIICLERSDSFLRELPQRARASVLNVLRMRGIQTRTHFEVKQITDRIITSTDGESLSCCKVISAAGASLPEWLVRSGLAISPRGFLDVENTLQSASHPDIFALGDIADIRGMERPKSGVFAVRQARPFVLNLRRKLRKKSLKSIYLQKRFLKIIGTDKEEALFVRGTLSFIGRWPRVLKDIIDGRFIRQFHRLPIMNRGVFGSVFSRKGSEEMYCNGCGGKVGREQLCINLQAPLSDSSRISVKGNQELVQSVDFFTPFTKDPYSNAQFAFHHAAADLLVEKVKPQNAHALLMLPRAVEDVEERLLEQFMSGSRLAAQQYGSLIVGGHSAVGDSELTGFEVSAIREKVPQALYDVDASFDIIISRRVGLGTLLAGYARGFGSGCTLELMKKELLQSQLKLLPILQEKSVLFATDVTGFGLLGHLLNKIAKLPVHVTLLPDHIPLYPGVRTLCQIGIRSSLYQSNLQSILSQHTTLEAVRRYPWLIDPQTTGPILFGIASDNTKATLHKMRKSGFPFARVIGQIEGSQNGFRLSLAPHFSVNERV